MSSMGLLMYTINYRPYTQKNIFYFELLNEATLLTASYFLIVFCDILMDNELRYKIGWYIVAITLFNVLANWLNLVVSAIIGLCRGIRAWC